MAEYHVKQAPRLEAPPSEEIGGGAHLMRVCRAVTQTTPFPFFVFTFILTHSSLFILTLSTFLLEGLFTDLGRSTGRSYPRYVPLGQARATSRNAMLKRRKPSAKYRAI